MEKTHISNITLKWLT